MVVRDIEVHVRDCVGAGGKGPDERAGWICRVLLDRKLRLAVHDVHESKLYIGLLGAFLLREVGADIRLGGPDHELEDIPCVVLHDLDGCIRLVEAAADDEEHEAELGHRVAEELVGIGNLLE